MSFSVLFFKVNCDCIKYHIVFTLQEIVLALKQWETKSNFMWDTAVKVVPVHLRTQGITEPTPIRAIADYETATVSCLPIVSPILVWKSLV